MSGIVDDTIVERLDDRPHPGERRAQVVRHPGDELAARRFERSLAESRGVEALLHHVELVRELRRAPAARVGATSPAAVRSRLPTRRATSTSELLAAPSLAADDERGRDADGAGGEEHDREDARSWLEMNIARDAANAPAMSDAIVVSVSAAICVPERPGPQRVQRERARAEPDERHAGGDAAELGRVGGGHRRHRGREERERATDDDGRDR